MHNKNSIIMDNYFVSKFVKSVLSTGIASCLSIVSSFISIIIATRFIPKEHFGVYILIQVIVSCVTMLNDFGLNMATIKFISSYEEKTSFEVVNTMLCYKAMTSLSVCLVIYLCKGRLSSLTNSPVFLDIFDYLPILFLLETLGGLLGAIQQGFQYFRRMAIAQIILSVASCGLTVLLVVIFKLGILGLIYARIISLVFSISFQIRPFLTGIDMKFRKDRLKAVFGFGFPLGLNSVLTFIFTRIDTILIGVLLSPVQVASYGTASKIPDASRQIFESFRSVFFPNMSELFGKDRKIEAEMLLNTSVRLLSFFSLLCTLLVVLFQREITTTLFTSKYADSAPLLSLLMFALSISLIGNVMGTTLVSAGFSKLPVMINIVDAVSNLAANLILIPIYGVTGAAFAAVMARALSNPVNIFFLKKKGIDTNIGGFIRPVLVFASCIVVFQFFGFHGLLPKIFILSLYSLACASLSVISANDLVIVTRLTRRVPGPAGSNL